MSRDSATTQYSFVELVRLGQMQTLTSVPKPMQLSTSSGSLQRKVCEQEAFDPDIPPSWQRNSLSEELLSRQSRYWQQQLEHAATLQLPLDYPRSATETRTPKSLALELDQRQRQGLTALAATQRISLDVVMMAIHVVLLHRYSQQEDIVVGTYFGPDVTEAGVVANPLAIRARLRTGMTANALMRQLRDTCLEAQDNDGLPFEYLVDTLGVEPDAGQSPIFQTFFSLDHAARVQLMPADDIVADPRRGEIDTSSCDLTLSCTVHENGIRCVFGYRAELFAENKMKRMLGHFQALLNAIIEDGEHSIDLLPMLTDAECRHLLVGLNDADHDFEEECLQTLIERQVERTPRSVAVCYDATELTYEQLNQQANRLAHYLRRQGISPGQTVGICLLASHHALIAIMATVKSGAAYIPMDVDYPADRLQHMVNNAEMSLVLSLAEHAETTAVFSGVDVLCLDDDKAVWLDQPVTDPECVNRTEDMLYVVYTSGSMGLPKGGGCAPSK